MPRLSLYRPEKGNDYKFIDKTVWEMFQVGGTDVFVHKYIGPGSSGESTPTTPAYSSTSETQIQDLLFLENRDRKYDPDIYMLRGVYNVADTDFNLSQFGLFLQNDTIFITFHINDTVEKIGRKLISGDVIELPHLKDDFALNDLSFALKRFYVIEEVTRAAEGFSNTWYPHLYRAKCKPLVDSQEFKDILNGLADDTGGDTSTTLRDIVSTYEREMQITQAVLDQAELDSPKSGYDVTQFYDLKSNPDSTPEASGLEGYLLDDAIPPNGSVYTVGIAFPLSPTEGQYHLRTDYLPKRLFRYNGSRWIKIEDAQRMTLNNLGPSDTGIGDRFEGKDDRQTQKTSFINNDRVNTINGKQVPEKQGLSKALKPKAD